MGANLLAVGFIVLVVGSLAKRLGFGQYADYAAITGIALAVVGGFMLIPT